MNIQQIKTFITAAKCLNFTEAAAQLFISQPALSRQIYTMEKELNMQLFIRKQKSVYLTPAGDYLYRKLDLLYREYMDIIQEAQVKAAGYSAVFHIGILSGHNVHALLPDLMRACAKKYPNVQITLLSKSFSGLTDGLYDGSIDLIFTLLFDISKKEQLSFLKVKSLQDLVIMPKSYPLAAKDCVFIKDLAEENLFLISPDDSPEASHRYFLECKKRGFYPRFSYAPNLETAMLWVEAGMGIALINEDNMLTYHPDLKSIPVAEFENNPETDLVAVWHSRNQNSFLPRFLEELNRAIRPIS